MKKTARAHGTHDGFSMLEVLLFVAILAIIMGTVVSVVISTEESRIRQASISGVEQRGTQVLETLTKNIRRAETILKPSAGQTGSILVLQMALNAEYPTIFAPDSTGGILLAQKNDLSALLSPSLRVSKMVFRNIGNSNVVISFDLTTTIPIVQPVTYTRHFDATATLFPDDQSQSGGCGGGCALPTCTSHQYKWYQCLTDSCSLSTSTFAC